MGYVNISEHDQTFNGPVTGRRWKIIRPYVQDDWRITKDLTLNIGLAWDLSTPITEAAGRMADFLPPGVATGANATTGQLLVANQGGIGSSAGINMNWTGSSSHASARPGRFSAATRPYSAAAFPSITTPPGARVLRAFGRILPFSPRATSSSLGGAQSATPSGNTTGLWSGRQRRQHLERISNF